MTGVQTCALPISGTEYWEIPYLPIDPADVGREYEPIIRINSQSGKGGAAYIMEHNFGFDLPKSMHPEFGHIVQVETDKVGKEISPERISELFHQEYIDVKEPYQLLRHAFRETVDGEGHSHVAFQGTLRHTDTVFEVSGEGNGPIDAFFNAIQGEKISRFTFLDYASHAITDGSDSHVAFQGTLRHTDTVFEVSGEGNGPIDAFFNAIQGEKISRFTFLDYASHAITDGSDSQGVAYILLQDQRTGRQHWGVGLSHNINLAPLRAILAAINRAKRA